MSEAVQIRFQGADMYCPDCKRLLCRVAPDGNIALLAGKSSVEAMGFASSWDDISDMEPFIIHEATCLKMPCRIRRALRDAREALTVLVGTRERQR